MRKKSVSKITNNGSAGAPEFRMIPLVEKIMAAQSSEIQTVHRDDENI